MYKIDSNGNISYYPQREHGTVLTIRKYDNHSTSEMSCGKCGKLILRLFNEGGTYTDYKFRCDIKCCGEWIVAGSSPKLSKIIEIDETDKNGPSTIYERNLRN